MLGFQSHDRRGLERYKVDHSEAVRFVEDHYSDRIRELVNQPSLQVLLNEFGKLSEVLFDSWAGSAGDTTGREYSVQTLNQRIGRQPTGEAMLVIMEVACPEREHGEWVCYQMPKENFLRVFSDTPLAVSGFKYVGDVFYFSSDGRWAVKIDHDGNTLDLAGKESQSG
ncbi:MAG: hypothetical protein RL326_1748 [Pseudomonadota bacterium]